MKTEIKYKCKRCGSEDIIFTYDAKWDVEEQRMRLDKEPVVVFCVDCDDETYEEVCYA